jgi:hypothetical protein
MNIVEEIGLNLDKRNKPNGRVFESWQSKDKRSAKE